MPETRREFRPQVFLFMMLALIFLTEAIFLGVSFRHCAKPVQGRPEMTVSERCPSLSEKSESLFLAAIATTLSLMSASSKPPDQLN